jgi:hypothetical protein
LLLVCHLCDERYNDEMEPLMLPCGKTVCSKCVAAIEFNDLTFKCISCLNDHLNPIDAFPVNKMAKDLSSIEAKNMSRKDCEPKKNRNQLDSFINDSNEKIKIERNKFKEQCKELKHQARHSANKRFQEINNNLNKCLNRIDDYEREYDRIYSTETPKKNQFCFSFELEARLESSKLENNRIKFEINDNELEPDVLGCFIRKHKYMPYSTIISCTNDFTIKIFNLESGELLRTYKGHLKEINCIKVILNDEIESKYIASGSDDKTIKIWEIKSKICVTTLEGHTEGVKCLEVLSENILGK